MARQIATASGPCGNNRDYLFCLEKAMYDIGHEDDIVIELANEVRKVLELGIVSPSVIIGLSLGGSQTPCTIRPLIAAPSFHQFFEGFALGGCISQAQFKASSATLPMMRLPLLSMHEAENES